MSFVFASTGDYAQEINKVAPLGHHIALRVGFAFPLEEINALPRKWLQHYAANRMVVQDPVFRWAYAKTGTVRWSELEQFDPFGVIAQAKDFGLNYGVSVACIDEGGQGVRSFGSFLRGDREFTDDEMAMLLDRVQRLHRRCMPPSNITFAETEALSMIGEGMRLKQIAHELGVTEGAVKQRLKNAKSKLGANTSAQAASLARAYGLI
ncbi:LuxR family transcriptional regulator [Marivivens niveibacter]|uniref:LuxR family transcriptional regulator n=1 Tax=Marivivens niveibacter TaxID=1930667 RepID=A0A251X2Q4_9RHOB|nr:autoinducer binding domain-containing protein [Marivivens niveibacter]OUD10668.1 LuxR family transcriptional regulator [Marivivens niveibacter]